MCDYTVKIQQFIDESGSINYCLCTVFVSFAVMYSFLVTDTHALSGENDV